MRDAGAQIVSVEAIIFDLVKNANNPMFKKLMPIIKDKLPKDEEGRMQTLDL